MSATGALIESDIDSALLLERVDRHQLNAAYFTTCIECFARSSAGSEAAHTARRCSSQQMTACPACGANSSQFVFIAGSKWNVAFCSAESRLGLHC